MSATKQTNVSLGEDDRELLDRLADEMRWSKTATVRHALAALDQGLAAHRMILRGYSRSDVRLGAPPDDEQREVYARVVQEMGYKTAIAEATFGRGEYGAAHVEIGGFRYSLDGDRLVAFRDSVIEGVEYVEMFEVRDGGLRPGLRMAAGDG